MVEINGKPLSSYPREVQGAIKAQPGYCGSGMYCISRSVAGQTRLYKMVDSKWMDASLNDVPSLAPYAPTTEAARALGSIRTPLKSKSSRENGKKGGRPKGKARKG